ncbi:MAG TPA: DUF4252 domain-containing protein [Chryseosolibacter sp.]|nr:DUF4252 domain-containing protein [Chryseosolibacter sp.]
MSLRFSFLAVVFTALSGATFAQSETTEALNKKYDSQAFFFYHNTLRMMNQEEDPAFDELIKDIEKIKFLLIRKNNGDLDYKKVVNGYKTEKFEEAMSSRHQGKSFDVFLKEKNNKTTAMLVLVNDAETLMVLDIVGAIALDQVTKLYSTIGESSEIGKRIRDFVDDDKKSKDN